MTAPDIDAFEKRAAIAEYDGGLSREGAEDLAARALGFDDADDYWRLLTMVGGIGADPEG